ncbi:response regulator transcription factor [Sphingobacterium lactis]|uniref:DNA-binding response regulator, OmpR family, contains REC and winged-helix (WHTH) domain n=1 Tax=Sphingobacterium lactis TaxID=797291 RepID=A0A1H5SVP7_9SPHI|nr:response regulator transcription factor [Sphingobacterium lactis]SEF54673.1 DNA-binding response regulator, OmpR family, contains REC and winged-helix (wHTH) domain [Sphingobacterium lactis]
MTNILYVEDEESLAMIVSDSLQAHGFMVRHVTNGQQALVFHNKYRPDIIVLDVMMPLMDGFTVAKEIRKTDLLTPIIFLTAMTQTEDVVAGFKLGANDYIRKPFKIEELIVRIEAALKKNGQSMAPSKLIIGDYTLDCIKSLLTFGDSSEKLSYREVELLKRLIEQKDKVVPRDEIIRTYWSNDTYFTGRSLDVFISRIRKYLAQDERIKISNIRGVGYMLSVD